MQTPAQLLPFDKSLEHFGSAIAILSDDSTCLSYAELAQRVQQVQSVFQKDSKQLICIRCGLNIPSIICYLAALRAGQAVLIVNADLDEKSTEELEHLYAPEWIFEPVTGQHSYQYQDQGHGLRQTKNAHASPAPIHPELALLLSTSGTTGSPKMVRLTRKNLYANAASIVEYLSIDQDERAITSLPMHYSYGLSVINTHLAAGAAIVLTEKSLMNREFWDTFKQYRATSLAGVPYHYEMLLRLRFFSMELPSLKTLTQAGGKLRANYVQKFVDYTSEKDLRFFVMYGQTEATARIAYIPAEQIAEKTSSIGIAIPGGKLWLEDSSGAIIDEEGRQGELIYQGPNVMMGYASCRDDLSTGDTLCGRLRTGDLATRDHDGFFTITGRLKRFVKLFGNRVNLDEVEQLLKQHGFEALCGGEDNALLIVLTDASMQDQAKKCVIGALKVHQSAITTAVVDKFYVTDTGKIDYIQTFQAV